MNMAWGSLILFLPKARSVTDGVLNDSGDIDSSTRAAAIHVQNANGGDLIPLEVGMKL